MDGTVKLIIFCTIITIVKAPPPGTFFWKPRLGLDLAIPTTPKTRKPITGGVLKPTVGEIRSGHAVLITGYQLGVTVLALAHGQAAWEKFPHLNPFKAWFYTTAYRWGLRHLSLFPKWLDGSGYNFIDTHRVWRKRYSYQDRWVPEWLQWFLPHVWEFDREKKQYRRFHRYVLPSFAKHYHYPGKVFDHWASEDSTETVENLDISDFSIHVNAPDY
ncbi:hypothetical protein RR48_15452 [Papilio machaon]|uniref:Uncharacterized protein n=1 Tax=Papilio machaon TaxID=76193 RepID=A0A194R0E5_PAPMA|nr:uncharacterized protein LOC106717033 [Papilio machaon]KPJ09311.1 hypothetical protein RR48_15452 [Papilio machaon]